MKDHNPHDPVNIIGEAYELLLEKTMHDLHVHDGVDDSASQASADKTSINANQNYMHWIEDKKFLLKNTALDYLGEAADGTTVTLRRLYHPQYSSENQNKKISAKHNHGRKSKLTTIVKHSSKKNKAFRRIQ